MTVWRLHVIFIVMAEGLGKIKEPCCGVLARFDVELYYRAEVRKT